MIIRIASIFKNDFDIVFGKATKTSTLFFVSKPILFFTPILPKNISEKWEEGWRYVFSIKLFNIIPIGEQTIYVEHVNIESGEIKTSEKNGLVRVWDHVVTIRKIKEGKIEYIDSLEIEAGFITPLIWIFVQVFYRYRQKRWKTLLE